MKITIERTFGIIEVEDADSKELVKEMSFWQSLPNNCPKCNSALSLFFRSPKDNDYFGLVCKGDKKHESNFGQYKKGGFYYKGEWQDAYVGGVVGERDAEIAKHDNLPPSTTTLDRIRNAEKAIRELGDEVKSFNPTGKSQFELDLEIEELTEQYKKLKASKE